MALLLPPAQQFLDLNGNPLSGGSITFYSSGTTTLKAVYSDAALTVALANPYSLDAAGRLEGSVNAYSGDGERYTIEVKDSTGATSWTRNDVFGAIESDSGAAAAYTSTETGAVATTIAAKLGEVVSVKDFGALGDGATDDTQAIQAAIDALEENTPDIFSTYGAGGRLFFPRGIYVITAELAIRQDGVVLEGETRIGTVIRQDAANTNTVYFGLSEPENNQRINGCGIRNLTLVYNGGSDPSSGAHVWFDRARASVIDNCTIINHYRGVVMAGVDEHCRFVDSLVIQGGNTTALQANSCAAFVGRREVLSTDPNAVLDASDGKHYVRSGSVHFSNLQVVGNQYGMDHCIDVSAVDGLYIENSHIGWAINNVIRIRPVQSNLSIQNVFGSNLLLDNTSANIGDGTVETKRGIIYQVNGTLSTQPTVINHYWSNCSFSGNDDKAVWVQDGWTTNLHDIRFSNCSFKNANAEGVRLESGFDFDFSGCSFEANDASGADGSRSHFYTDTNKVNLTGCRFSGTTARGIYIDTDGDYVTGSNLQIFNTSDQPFLINTTNDNHRFSGVVTDTGDSIESAATMFVPPELPVAYVTGTVTINSIKSSAGSEGSSAWEGREIKLIFDAAAGVADSVGNINLSAAFTATAGDVLQLIYRGGTWYETGRSAN